MFRRKLILFGLLPLACGGAQVKKETGAEPPASPVGPSAPPPAPPLVKLRAPAPLEGDDGIVGEPRDETAFEFEPEVAQDDDEPPQISGVSALSPTVLKTIDPYLYARRARLASVSSDGSKILILTRLGETTQAHILSNPLAMREQVSFGRQPVQQASFIPGSSEAITYRADVSGNEDHQVLFLDLVSRQRTLVSDGRARQGPYRWSPKATYLAFTGNARNGVDMDLYLARGHPPAGRDLVRQNAGQWVIMSWSRDERRILLQEYRSNTETALHILDLEQSVDTPLAASKPGVTYGAALFGSKGDDVYAISNRDGEFRQLFRYDLGTGTWTKLSQGDWDVEEFALRADQSTIIYNTNQDGLSQLWRLDQGQQRARLLKHPKGIISDLRFAGKGDTVAFSLTTATSPMDVFTLELKTGKLTRWTKSEIGGIPPSTFVDPKLVRFTSFDKLKIPAYYFKPPGAGPFPVLIWMHGGPEDQFRPAFDPLLQYFVGRLGIAVIAPNVRGSDGYGKTFMSLDDGMHRADAVKDVGALLDFIAGRPELDRDKVGIHGASYGGYMVLASLVAYPDRIAAGSDVVGISNFITFLENTSEYRQDIRRVEYGDEREPATREFLRELSPLNGANRIRSALLVAHGENDPRVPVAEAEAIVEAVRASGNNAWFMLARTEGHSFRKRSNRDAFCRLMGTFFAKHLLGLDDANNEETAPAPSEIDADDGPDQLPTSESEPDSPPDVGPGPGDTPKPERP